MRFTLSTLLLGILALTSTTTYTYAFKINNNNNALSRLSQRLSNLETTLTQLTTHTQTQTHTQDNLGQHEDDSTKWWGHTTLTTVQFANQVVSEPTGDITVSGTFLDTEFRSSNQLWFHLYGVTGVSNHAGVAVDYQGTHGSVTWDADTEILVFRPAASMPKVAIGAPWSFTIPGSALHLVNPSVTQLAGPNDPRWAMSVFHLELDQTPGNTQTQALQWQPIQHTPETQDPTAELI